VRTLANVADRRLCYLPESRARTKTTWTVLTRRSWLSTGFPSMNSQRSTPQAGSQRHPPSRPMTSPAARARTHGSSHQTHQQTRRRTDSTSGICFLSSPPPCPPATPLITPSRGLIETRPSLMRTHASLQFDRRSAGATTKADASCAVPTVLSFRFLQIHCCPPPPFLN
jgi:hypothetical protein